MTGASSFTGVWIAEALARAGFEVVAPLLRAEDAYEGVRLERVRRLQGVAAVRFGVAFGSDAFLALMQSVGPLEAFVHHAARITGYRSPAFDPVAALAQNTHGAPAVLQALRRLGGRVFGLTGSVFEAGEGGEADSGAVTPYGLSKTLTTTAFRYWSGDAGLRFARVVIPSPYGPLEEPRFGAYLFRSWFAGETPVVKTPLYVRDHIAAGPLAAAYADCVRAALDGGAGEVVARPSGWIASQGDFARRVAEAARTRLGLACPLELARQETFDEPATRVNSDPVPAGGLPDDAFWDEYVDWYASLHARGALSAPA